MGVIALSGIIINNAIVLIDRIKIKQDYNVQPLLDAILAAYQGRFWPIFLTTCTTIGGMLPLYNGGGPMFEPMAIATIFGFFFATPLTLGVRPVLYPLFIRVGFRAARLNEQV